jgi:UDP:flavonoid glycosyltransferase YjiC (YdhE family)
MRILFSACPLSGHISTILPLALAARAAGHEVVVATGSGVAPQVRRHDLETWPVGTPMPALPGGGTAAQRSAFFANSAVRRAEDLLPRAESWSPHLVISDTAEVAGAVAAAVTGARHVVHGLGIMPPIGMWNAYAMHLDGLLVRWGVPASADMVREATYLDVCPPALRRRNEPIWSTTLDLRPTTSPWGTVPAGIDALPHRDTVLARPASTADADAILNALRNQPINLIMRADPVRFGSQPANVLIAAEFPHAAVLSRCRALISPGGPGVTLAALAHGLPQLILSQETTAPDGDITHAGAALTVNAAAPQAIERAVRNHIPRLLTDPTFAASAAWVQVEIAAMSSPESVVRNLTTEAIPVLR